MLITLRAQRVKFELIQHSHILVTQKPFLKLSKIAHVQNDFKVPRKPLSIT